MRVWNLLLIVCCFGLGPIAFADDEPLTAVLQDPGEFSPASVPLKWSVSQPTESVTYSIFVRDVVSEGISLWETVALDSVLDGTSASIPVEDRSEVEFRIAANAGDQAQRIVLGQFEPGSSTRAVLPVWHTGAMKIKVGYLPDEAPQGSMYAQWQFRLAFPDEIDPATPSLTGVFFTNVMPTRDWSQHRYLEMLVRISHPDVPITLNLKSGEYETTEPLMPFSQGTTDDGWHLMVVDLDEVMPERADVTRFALVANSLDLPLDEDYVIGLDDVSLWRDRQFVRTTIDPTPPSPPEDMIHAMQNIFLEWRWNEAEDAESGIQGYSVSWSSDVRDMPDNTIDVTLPFYRKGFLEPQRYREFYFRIKALNGAGVWSPVATKTVTYNPATRQ